MTPAWWRLPCAVPDPTSQAFIGSLPLESSEAEHMVREMLASFAPGFDKSQLELNVYDLVRIVEKLMLALGFSE
jgi:hypothetical protein